MSGLIHCRETRRTCGDAFRSLFRAGTHHKRNAQAGGKEENSSGRRADVPVRPRYMVWENVPGAFSSGEPKGADFKRVLEEVCGISEESVSLPGPPDGAWTPAGIILGQEFSVAWRVLDAQFWGVPQRRRRIFLIADFGGHSAGEILFESESVWRHYQESREQRKKLPPILEAALLLQAQEPTSCV